MTVIKGDCNILKIEKVVETVFYVTTDEKHYPEYRRSESGVWENLMGDVWEEYYSDDLEKLFKEYRTQHQEYRITFQDPKPSWQRIILIPIILA